MVPSSSSVFLGRLQSKDVRLDQPDVAGVAAEHCLTLEMKNGTLDKTPVKIKCSVAPRSLVAVSVSIMTAVKVKAGIHFAWKHCGV